MDKLLSAGYHLDGRFRISDVIGQGDETAAYLAADLDSGGAWSLVWESVSMFRMRQKPEGVLHYLAADERHYLVLRLEGQDLGLVYTAAGAVASDWAALWLFHVCDGIGQWHTRRDAPQVCLDVGDIRLADLRLMANGRAILPTCDILAQPVTSVVAGQTLSFSSPEKVQGEPLTPRSDVYALGAALYCLVTGAPPPDPGVLASGEAELLPPRKVRREIPGRLEKIITKAMSLNPRQRQESARQLSFDLQRCVPRQLRRNIGAL